MKHLAKLIAVLVALLHTEAMPVEFGITPRHVFGIWLNINTSLDYWVSIADLPDETKKKYSAIAQKEFTGKKPKDVLGLVTKYRETLNTIRNEIDLSHIKVYNSVREDTTPSDVFLNSGHVIDGQMEALVKLTKGGVLVSKFYKQHALKDKIPSQVFSKVDLAIRRLHFLLPHLDLRHKSKGGQQ